MKTGRGALESPPNLVAEVERIRHEPLEQMNAKLVDEVHCGSSVGKGNHDNSVGLVNHFHFHQRIWSDHMHSANALGHERHVLGGDAGVHANERLAANVRHARPQRPRQQGSHGVHRHGKDDALGGSAINVRIIR